MDGAGDHAPDHAVETIIVAGAEGDRRVVRIFGNQRPLIGMAFVQPFDRELAADDGDDDAARFGFEMRRSPGKIPTPVIESPLTRTINVAAGRWIRCSFRSNVPSTKSSAGEGNPAGTAAAIRGSGQG
jgi:hypothetical protein